MSVWDRLAAIYDWQLPFERRPVAVAVELADPGPRDRVLDVATGTGAVLRALAKRPTPPDVAVGLDRSEAMMSRVPSLPAGWSLEHGDAANLPFPADDFDVAIASYVLHLLDRPLLEQVLRELGRVLKPGGRLATVTPISPRSPLRHAWGPAVAALARVSRSSVGLRPMDPCPELARAGLRPVTARYVHRGYPSLCVLARAGGSGSLQAGASEPLA